MASSSLDTQQSCHQGVDILTGVVERQGRTHSGLQTKATQNGLRAVMTGPYRDPFLVKCLAHVLGAKAIENKGKHAGLVPCRPNQMEAGDSEQSRRRVGEQVVLVASDIRHSDLLEVIEGGAQADRVSNIAGSRFESRRGSVVNRLLKRDVGNHAAAALPGWSVVENIGFSEDDAY